MARAARGIGQSATNRAQTIDEIKELLTHANASTLPAIERSLQSDTRKGVISALTTARKRIERETAERHRLETLYSFQRQLAIENGAKLYVGLDEVGRGSVAGPLAVGGVILPDEPLIEGLNDSKQLTPDKRAEISSNIKEIALGWTVQYIDANTIDAAGMTACLVMAFRNAVKDLERQGFSIDLILLDGNPLHFDKRERNIIKGDAKCASISAASIIAKVERDALMVRLSEEFPQYGWDQCKGYASASHIDAIKEHGLSPYHRKTFCHSFLQETLF